MNNYNYYNNYYINEDDHPIKCYPYFLEIIRDCMCLK